MAPPPCFFRLLSAIPRVASRFGAGAWRARLLDLSHWVAPNEQLSH
jgi:hypothetical protein